MASRLGIPPGSSWARLASRGAVPPGAAPVPVTFYLPTTTLEEVRPNSDLQRFAGYQFEFFGRRVGAEGDTFAHPYITSDYGNGEFVHILEVWFGRLFIPEQGVEAEAIWTPPGCRVVITSAGEEWEGQALNMAGRAARLLREFDRRKRGPEPGTVKAAKYKTPEQWHTAIREKVLTKRTVASAPDYQIAQDWLGISKATMHRLMRKWGPSALEDLRNGKL